MAAFMTSCLKLTVEYIGTAYHGWQFQPGLPTVQGVLQDGLSVALRAPAAVTGAARTDAGVHAFGQAASLEIPTGFPIERLQGSLNSLIPRDISVRSVETVPAGFHARHSAIGRVYRYQMVDDPFVSPFLRGFSAHSRHRLDVDAMEEAASALIGRMDFSSFKASGDRSESPVKEIVRSEIRVESGHQRVIVYTVEATSFLQYMVRNIAGTLMEVGRGRFRPDGMISLIESCDRRNAGPTAPAAGLTLVHVRYPVLRDLGAGDRISTLNRGA
jgi:tRNA pseudouridine38-40 synthase